MNNLRRLLTGTALLLAACGLASADSISFVTSNPRVNTGTELTGNLLFAQFDPTWGTLNSITLNFLASYTTNITVTNSSESSSSGNVRTEVFLSLTDAGNFISPSAPQLDTTIPGIPFSYSLAPGGSVSSGDLTRSGITYTFGPSSLAGFLSEFTGTGNTALGISTFTQTLLANTGGNTAASQVTTASLTGTVVYDYTAPPSGVPEPATMALMGSALLGLGLLRKRLTARK